ncbi:MAG: histidine--tRNA ligase [Candidatus Micrarchaeota archaeon]
MDLTPVRGSRDFLAGEKLLRDATVSKLKRVFELYGFNPLETPALEYLEVLSSKYAGGEEIIKEIYSLEDQGKRKLGLRYDLTVPLCRVVAGNKFAMPFKRYAIDLVWRDGPIKAGRYREFVQCDVDVLGVESVWAEAELISLLYSAFNELGLRVVVKVNSRKLLNSLLSKAGVKEEKFNEFILSLDKLEKIGVDGVKKELKEKGFSVKIINSALSLLKEKDLVAFKSFDGAKDLQELFDYSRVFSLPEGVLDFTPSLARGLSYYTGIVFEAFLVDSVVKSSVAAGGRYDDLVGAFSGKEKIPAVGFSFGLDVICEELKQKALDKTVVSVLVIPFKNTELGVRLVQTLRAAGVNSVVDLVGKNVSKNLDYASKEGIRFVAFYGEKELAEGKVKLRDMNSGVEELFTEEGVVEAIKKGLN